MKIFVTGATGFIGTNLIKRLINEDHEVICFVRDINKARRLLPNKCELLQSNAFDNHIIAALETCDGVINLAGEPIIKRWTKANKKKIFESRVNLTKRLARLIDKCNMKPSVFISGSAIGYYGDRDKEILEELESWKPLGWLAYLCKEWEAAADTISPIRVVNLRTGIVLGNGGALKKMLLPFKLGLGGALGNGKQWMSWIHIDDMVEIIISSLTNKWIEGPVNCVAPNPVINSEFTKRLGYALRRPTIFPVPAFVLKLIFGDGASVLLDSQRVEPKALKDVGFQWRFRSLKRALEDLV